MVKRGWLKADWHLITLASLLVLIGLAWTAAELRPEHSFDEIKALVTGKTAAQVILLLGEPDKETEAFSDAERWIWWEHTYLEGNNFAPEQRGEIVHLEIIIVRPPAAPENLTKEHWIVSPDGHGISYFGLDK